MNPQEIAARITEMRAAMVYSALGGMVLASRRDRARLVENLNLPPNGFMQHGRRDGSMHKLALEPYFHDKASTPSTNLKMIDAWPNLMIIELGHLLGEEDYFDKRPLLEFVRQVRNAIAHGDRFNIKGRWWRDAKFSGIELSKQFDGVPLKDVLRPGDLLALVDAVEAELNSFDT